MAVTRKKWRSRSNNWLVKNFTNYRREFGLFELVNVKKNRAIEMARLFQRIDL